jgi:hypothetical protein
VGTVCYGGAIKANNKQILYFEDAYYMRVELNDMNHPVNELARIRADNELRIATVDKIRKPKDEYPEIEVFGYHERIQTLQQ